MINYSSLFMQTFDETVEASSTRRSRPLYRLTKVVQMKRQPLSEHTYSHVVNSISSAMMSTVL